MVLRSKRSIMRSKLSSVILSQCYSIKEVLFLLKCMCVLNMNCVNVKNLEGSFCVWEPN